MTILLVIVGVLIFNLIIIAHEFGHYFTARSFGIKVNEFALGMGPKILKFKSGETLFSLRLFPVGGFCAMEGEDEESKSPSSFEKKAAWKRAVVVVTGAVMNIVIGFLMTVFLLAQSSRINSTVISGFKEDAVSSSYGLKAGDEILKINGNKINIAKDIAFSLTADGKEKFNIEVKRGDLIADLQDITFKTSKDEKGNFSIYLDFYLKPMDKNFASLMRQSFFETIYTVKTVWVSLIGLMTGKFAPSNFMGPIGITSFIGQATTEGLKVSAWAAIVNIITIMAMITINLGIINLLPIPGLDGGRLVFLIFEMITRKKIDPKYEGLIHAFGLILIVILMIFISYSDVMRLFG